MNPNLEPASMPEMIKFSMRFEASVQALDSHAAVVDHLPHSAVFAVLANAFLCPGFGSITASARYWRLMTRLIASLEYPASRTT